MSACSVKPDGNQYVKDINEEKAKREKGIEKKPLRGDFLGLVCIQFCILSALMWPTMLYMIRRLPEYFLKFSDIHFPLRYSTLKTHSNKNTSIN